MSHSKSIPNADSVQRNSSEARAYLWLLVASVCWGANTVFGRLAVGEVSPMLLVTLRWAIASALLLTFRAGALRRDWPKLRPRLGLLAVLGAFGFTVFNELFYSAAHHTTAVNMGILQGGTPILVVLFAFIADRTRSSRSLIAAILLSLASAVLVATGGHPLRLLSLSPNPGDLLILVASALYAAYAVALRRGPQVSTSALLTVLATAAFISSLPFAAWEWSTGRAQPPTFQGWLVVLAVATIPSLLAQASFIVGVQKLGAARAGLFINLVPVTAAAMGSAFLAEPFEVYHAVGLGLVLVGVWLSRRARST